MRRRLPALATAGLLTVVLAGCEDDAPNDDGPLELSPRVLTPGEITDAPRNVLITEGLRDVEPIPFARAGDEGCASDDLVLESSLSLGRKAGETLVLTRTVAGHDERVITGAWRSTSSIGAARVLQTLASSIQREAPGCRGKSDEGMLEATLHLVGDIPDADLAFRTTTRITRGDPSRVKEQESDMRAYAIVGGYLVVVYLERSDGSDPRVADLRDLFAKAIANAEANI